MKWVNASDRMPVENKMYVVRTAYSDAPCVREYISGSFVNYDGYKVVKWLDETESPAPEGWVRPPVTGSLLLLELMQVAAIKNEDGMPVVEYVDKPNGGSVAYLRHDAVVNKLNALLNMPPPQPPKQ